MYHDPVPFSTAVLQQYAIATRKTRRCICRSTCELLATAQNAISPNFCSTKGRYVMPPMGTPFLVSTMEWCLRSNTRRTMYSLGILGNCWWKISCQRRETRSKQRRQRKRGTAAIKPQKSSQQAAVIKRVYRHVTNNNRSLLDATPNYNIYLQFSMERGSGGGMHTCDTVTSHVEHIVRICTPCSKSADVSTPEFPYMKNLDRRQDLRHNNLGQVKTRTLRRRLQQSAPLRSFAETTRMQALPSHIDTNTSTPYSSHTRAR